MALGGDSIGKFELEFWLEKSPEFWLEIPTLRKSSNMGSLDMYVSESKWNVKLFFKPKVKPKNFY